MPGVVVTTGVRTGPSNAAVAPASTFFLCGTAERGPIGYNAATDALGTATLVTSLADFEAYYGGYNSSNTLHQHAQTFFEEGGTRAYISRVVGASATAGTLSLVNGSAVASLRLDAANTGTWSSGVTAAVLTGSGTFAVKIYFDGSLVYNTGYVATCSAAADKINSSDEAGIYVTATALVGANVLAAVSATALSAGVNGAAPTAMNLVDGLEAFDPAYGAGAVAIPGQNTAATHDGLTVYDDLIAHGVANNRIAILAIANGETAADAVTIAESYAGGVGAEYAGFYFPHITITNTSGVSLTLSPESYVAAKRAVAHAQVGPWQAGAGLLSAATFVTGLATSVSKADADTLDEGRVNALRVIQGAVRVYGARSASDDDENYRYITYRDLLNYIIVEAEKRLEDLVFSTIDGRKTVFGRVEARLIGLLDPIRTAGGLYEAFNTDGSLLDPGYSVQVNDAINPVNQLATGLIRARVGVRVSSVGDRIEVEVLKSNLTSSVV
jgi:hypothetical protein